jgi:hypothetical protein
MIEKPYYIFEFISETLYRNFTNELENEFSDQIPYSIWEKIKINTELYNLLNF